MLTNETVHLVDAIELLLPACTRARHSGAVERRCGVNVASAFAARCVGACVKWLCHLVIWLHVASRGWYSAVLCAPARVLTSGRTCSGSGIFLVMPSAKITSLSCKYRELVLRVSSCFVTAAVTCKSQWQWIRPELSWTYSSSKCLCMLPRAVATPASS